MGKVITNKIIVINKDNSPIILENKPTKPSDAMHFDEEQVLVFDKDGNCVGNVAHEEVKDLF